MKYYLSSEMTQLRNKVFIYQEISWKVHKVYKQNSTTEEKSASGVSFKTVNP